LVNLIESDDLINLKVWNYIDLYIKKNDYKGIVLPLKKLVVIDLLADFKFDKFRFLVEVL